MNYDFLWSMDEYQSLLDYKWNAFKYINMFLSDSISNRERKFNPNAKAYPKTSDEFKKAIETILNLYRMIKKNYLLNGSPEYSNPLFRGVRKNSVRSYFTSTSESFEIAISFIDGLENGDVGNDVLLDIDSSDAAWIDLELFIPASKGGDLSEKEILFLPCEYQTLQEMKLPDYLNTSGQLGSLSRETQMRLSKLIDLTCRKVRLVAPSYNVSTYVSLEALASGFEQYRQNLIKYKDALENGKDTFRIEKDIIEFKKFCSGYLKSQFNEIDKMLSQQSFSDLSQNSIHINSDSVVQEVHIGNTGRMFYVSNGIDDYYFKPAESKDKTLKPYRAYIQEAAYNVQRIINPSRAIRCNSCEIDGIFGAVQEKIDIDKEATLQFRRCFQRSGGELSSKLLSQILDEYLVDYCLCNYDTHARNFIVDVNGNLRGIDKEQSFRYIHDDKNDDMLFSKNYNKEYGESESIYASIFKKMMNGEISYKVLEGLNYRAARLAQVPDLEYRELFKKYAYSKTKSSEDAELLLDRIVKRKQLIMKKIDWLKQYVYNKSYGKGTDSTEYIYTDEQDVTPSLDDEKQNLYMLRQILSDTQARVYIGQDISGSGKQM